MDYYIYPMSNGTLCHHGIKGMKWGIRRYQNKDGSFTPAGEKRWAKKDARSDRDMRNLEETAKKAGTAMQRHLEFMDKHKSGNLYIYNRNLLAEANKRSKDVDKMVLKLSKKYDLVSVIPEKDIQTGKMYVDVTIDNKKSRIDID